MVERSSTDTEQPIYSPYEQRVADYLSERGIGGGDDPIGFLLASYTYVVDQLGVAQTRCSVCGSGDAMVICEGCWARRPAQAAPDSADEIGRLRKALELLTDELPEEMHTLDEPDEDWEVIVKMRAIAREALSPSHRGSPP